MNKPRLPIAAYFTTLFAIVIGILSLHATAALPVIQMRAGMHLIHAELAATPATRQQGLMYRQQLGENQGMLFVFEQPGQHCFWMRNTLLPLSIAFLADDGKIVNIEDMQAQTENNHCPTANIRYALEMSQGWFAQKGLKPGMQINGLPDSKTPY